MTDPVPIAVSAHGFSWTAAGAWATFLVLLSALGVLVRMIGPWKKQTTDAEDKLRTDLMARVEILEKKLEHKDAIHAAERALDRHKIRNLNQCLDAVLMILETAPEKTVEVVGKVRVMREAQLKAEAAEAAAIHAAEIAASGGE
ncbi:hypothetical protein [Sphingobium cupriresistens]|uniref:Uncharacterized protein n=1 Tax=Sphingobium cupriresistens TaxID=1132417 RepID=A0A8G1ZEV6_9SPHN|nr:hypothetical protein [Sphingobium cupriresistens]RYM07986.1 hypothetical protein EWH12_17785 [Sphingobium cupriresistens]